MVNDSLRSESGPVHIGPSLLGVGAAHTLLFLGSVVAGAILTHGAPFPLPFDPAATPGAYFTAHADALRLSAFLQFGSSIPLGIFAVTAVSRLRFLGVNVAGPFIALFGGIAAATMLALSALVGWILTQPGVAANADVARALHQLLFATGGPGYVPFFGLMVAGIAVSAGLHKLVPRWVMVLGLVVALFAEVASLSLVLPPLAVLLPAARFPGFVWILSTAALLAKSRGRGRRDSKKSSEPLSEGEVAA